MAPSANFCVGFDAFRGTLVAYGDATKINSSGPCETCDGVTVFFAGDLSNLKELAALAGVDGDHETPRPEHSVVLRLYQKFASDMPRLLRGKFALVLHDLHAKRLLAVRDVLGAVPLYQGWSTTQGQLTYFSSQLKTLADACDELMAFPPGSVFNSQGTPYKKLAVPEPLPDAASLRDTLDAAVARGLDWDRPAVLLSEDVGSVVVAWLAVQQHKQHASLVDEDLPKVVSLIIEPQDRAAAARLRRVAELLDTQPVFVKLDRDEVLQTLPVIIYHLETFDAEVVRKAIPLFVAMSKAKALGANSLLVGEGLSVALGAAARPWLAAHSVAELIGKLNVPIFFDSKLSDASPTIHAPFSELEAMQNLIALDQQILDVGHVCKKLATSQAELEELLALQVAASAAEWSSEDSQAEDPMSVLDQVSASRVSDKQLVAQQTGVLPITKEDVWYKDIFGILFKSQCTAAVQLLREV